MNAVLAPVATEAISETLKETMPFMNSNQKAVLFIGVGIVSIIVGCMFLNTHQPALTA